MTLPTDKVNALWVKASDDAEGMRLGYTMQHHYFAALIQREMDAENAELRKDAIKWLEDNHTLHTSVEILYVVDGYEVTVMHENGVTPLSKTYHGETLLTAIDRARSANE
jgi:hypothetical protein